MISVNIITTDFSAAVPAIIFHREAIIYTFLIENEIRDFFSDLFVSAIIGLEKPSKSFYDYIITSLGCESQEILMVGDDLVLDVYPAISVGITAIHLKESASFDTVSFDSQAHKYVTISDLSDLLEILI